MENTGIRTITRAGMRADRQMSGVYFDRRQIERLDQYAKDREVSRCHLIRLAVEKLLTEAGV